MKLSDYLSLSLKFILILSIITAINNHLWHIASTNLFLLILTFTPQIIKSQTKIKFPKEFELILFLFILITLLLGQIKIIIAPIIFGIGTGIIALFFLFILYHSNQIKKNYFLIILFSFCFSLTFATLLEISKYILKIILSQPLTDAIYINTMKNFIYVLIGSTIASIIGLIYMKTNFSLIKKLLDKIKIMNPDFFKKEFSTKEIILEIKRGEGESQEFKSTLRTNLHTNEIDKKIEHGILKTISSFLNTSGGILYIGVTDDGKILGIEKDNFENTDKFQLHLTNLIKQKIGKIHSGLIEVEIVKLKDRHIARINCKKSKKPIFITDGKDEYFYVRFGPQTQELKGSELLNYVKQKFDKNNKIQ